MTNPYLYSISKQLLQEIRNPEYYSQLSKLFPLTEDQIKVARASKEGAATLLPEMRNALRAERARGVAHHWSYSLPRHDAMKRAYDRHLAYCEVKDEVEPPAEEKVEQLNEGFGGRNSIFKAPPDRKSEVHWNPDLKMFMGKVLGEPMKASKEAEFLDTLMNRHGLPYKEALDYVKTLKAPHENKERIKVHLKAHQRFRQAARSMTHMNVNLIDKKSKKIIKTISEKRKHKLTPERQKTRKKYLKLAKDHMAKAKSYGYDPKTWIESIVPLLDELIQEGMTEEKFFGQYLVEQEIALNEGAKDQIKKYFDKASRKGKRAWQKRPGRAKRVKEKMRQRATNLNRSNSWLSVKAEGLRDAEMLLKKGSKAQKAVTNQITSNFQKTAKNARRANQYLDMVDGKKALPKFKAGRPALGSTSPWANYDSYPKVGAAAFPEKKKARARKKKVVAESYLREDVDTPVFTGLADHMYDHWNANRHLDRDEILAHAPTELHKHAMVLDKYVGQVLNGGHQQWMDNHYASHQHLGHLQDVLHEIGTPTAHAVLKNLKTVHDCCNGDFDSHKWSQQEHEDYTQDMEDRDVDGEYYKHHDQLMHDAEKHFKKKLGLPESVETVEEGAWQSLKRTIGIGRSRRNKLQVGMLSRGRRMAAKAKDLANEKQSHIKSAAAHQHVHDTMSSDYAMDRSHHSLMLQKIAQKRDSFRARASNAGRAQKGYENLVSKYKDTSRVDRLADAVRKGARHRRANPPPKQQRASGPVHTSSTGVIKRHDYGQIPGHVMRGGADAVKTWKARNLATHGNGATASAASTHTPSVRPSTQDNDQQAEAARARFKAKQNGLGSSGKWSDTRKT